MPGRFKTSPEIIGRLYKEVADYGDPPIAVDGNRAVYKGLRKVYLVVDGLVVDFYDWEVLGNQYRHVQKQAQRAWGIKWIVG